MFLSKADRERILDCVENDLSNFIKNSSGGGALASWEAARDEVEGFDKGFGHPLTALDFVSRLFLWIDEQFKVGLSRSSSPSYTKERIFVWGHDMGWVAPETRVAVFLRDLHKFLGGLTNSDENISPSYRPMRVFDFARLIAHSHGVKLHWVLKRNHYLKEFISWLYVENKTNVYVVYDDNKLRKPEHASTASRNPFFIEQCFEKVFLHELAHLRLHLPYFADGKYGVTALPRHETEAWLYALSLRACVVATRSRIDRFIGNPDGQWIV